MEGKTMVNKTLLINVEIVIAENIRCVCNNNSNKSCYFSTRVLAKIVAQWSTVDFIWSSCLDPMFLLHHVCWNVLRCFTGVFRKLLLR